MKARTDIILANRDNGTQWGVAESANVLHIPFPENVLSDFVCLFLNLIYFVTVWWLSFQSVIFCFSVQIVLLPKKVKGTLFMALAGPSFLVAAILGFLARTGAGLGAIQPSVLFLVRRH